MEVEGERPDFPVLLAVLGTLLLQAGGRETLLTAGRRDVAVLQVVVLGTVSPASHLRASTLNRQTDSL